MKKISLTSLDPFFEKVEKINKIQRILIYVGAFVLLIGPFAYFSFLPKSQKIDELSKEVQSLETQLASAKRQARQLKSWRAKYKKAQAQFNIAKKALPLKKEIPSLLASVSASGQQAGLDFQLFQPQGESAKQFYAEIPVSIK
ncbi:type 4a pilus biogenesis protein PilO, partial [Thermodesulfobacteriota bacterium]